MAHNSIDRRMKSFELYRGQCVPPESHIVVRLDGVGFSRLTQVLACEKPFDAQFIHFMQLVTQTLMTEVPDIKVGYVQSDEITLVFARDTDWFNRRIEKFASVLAAKASAHMALLVNQELQGHSGPWVLPAFDCRLSVFPTEAHVDENLVWRIDDSVKNCRNLLVFWGMVNKGMSKRAATKAMLNQGKDFQNEYLFTQLGVNFNEVDPVLKRGTLYYKATVWKLGWNPHKQEATWCLRPVIVTDPLPHTGQERPLAFIARRSTDHLVTSKLTHELAQ